MSENPKLYALLVAIDKYAYPVGPLGGCVNDIRRVAEYLKNDETHFDLHLEVLTDKTATRGNVEKGFLEHLGQAGEGDVALFYYSGHGAQEAADTSIWRFEPNGKLEGLVLYDSIPDRSGPYRLLADKELRFLIRQVASKDAKGNAKDGSPHIITVFDCCHSGENTRNIFVMEEGIAGETILERRYRPHIPVQEDEPVARMSTILPARKWEDFLFADREGVSRERLRKELLEEVLPQGAHVQLAACRSDESAYEVGGSGVFTKNLLEVLRRSRGSVSYYDLRSRLRHFIKNQFRQTPQIYETGENQLMYRFFLNKDTSAKPIFGAITWNPEEGWIMDLGAIHGVSQMARTLKIKDADSRTGYSGLIKAVKPTYTLVEIEGDDQPEKGAQLFGVIDDFLSAPMHVFINNHDHDEQAELRLRQLIENEGANIFLSPEQKQADYAVQIQFGTFAITLPGDRFRPLVMPLRLDSPDAERFTHNYLRHISQWEYVRNLHNDGPNRLPLDSIQVEVFRVAGEGELRPLDIHNDEIATELEPVGGALGGKLRIKLTNMAPFPVNVAFLYLGRQFEVYTEMLEQGVQRLDGSTAEGKAGGSVWVFDGNDIELELERGVEVFHWPYSETYLKLIASREDVDIRALGQEELPDPSGLSEGGSRGIKKQVKTEQKVEADAWMTRTMVLRLPNPNYDVWSAIYGDPVEGSPFAPYAEGLREEDGEES